jgi:hypothetical protein
MGEDLRRRNGVVSTIRAWRLVAVTLLAAIACAGWFVLTQEPDHPLGRRNYRRIMAGMTRPQVEEILGGPPGVMGQAPEQPSFVALVEQEGLVNALGALEGKPAVWYSDRGQIVVMFDDWDQSSRVIGKQLYRPAARR